jgi:hypothetical protein
MYVVNVKSKLFREILEKFHFVRESSSAIKHGDATICGDFSESN